LNNLIILTDIWRGKFEYRNRPGTLQTNECRIGFGALTGRGQCD